MKSKYIYPFFIIIIFALAVNIDARSFRVNQIPNGNVNTCSNCHVNPAGGGARNDFGQLVEANFLDGSGNVLWGPLLASYDADGDGVTNGEELQDRYGMWTIGDDAPGNAAYVSRPGVFAENNLSDLTVEFSGMTPHVGQTLYIRVLELSTMKEVARSQMGISESFSIIFSGSILPGHDYYIDFFADFNLNGVYDPPPVDHAWRLMVSADGNETVSFSHNTDFTDIEWRYEMWLQLTGMSPHSGQLGEFRLVDETAEMEIGRYRVESIDDSFDVWIPGMELGNDYSVQFYADFNGSGFYDSPPTDHAWEISFTADNGDESLNFSHNTDFTDISWDYSAVLNLVDMNPHAGQKFEARLVDNDTDDELGRITFDEIIVTEFSLEFPGVVDGGNYRLDFYADFNGNGEYDAPPADHAWRIEFTGSNSVNINNFAHNTSFTDIEWPDPTSVEKDEDALVSNYKLMQNYPNPFNPSTNISFSLAEDGFVSLMVFNILGEQLITLVNQELTAGSYNYKFDAAGIGNLESGIYFYRIETTNFIETKKMTLLK
ncbi:MAG: T9SS type A sorting domain-containing protein [Melioribacteraceae bacterium]|nr:T9SS type A sorting domain-containing protein [Melioribacteraceae bacterium]MCF8353001.1 T9SS type A sorting domain-containing protein [Melioribacteraceae bacterium]MCF8392892.1 T9SS type A sorting domain-containing protein [Melioribacteraceae bacterium]MCF8417814.1 T9SS type A sorting domain-containing protein [Melioribacteraceae bacterium]